MLWFTVKNLLFHELVLFGTLYIPPESSSYSNISSFESIENDIVSLNPENNHKICLKGDFSAHTSNAEDFIYVNDFICDAFNLEDVIRQFLNKSLLEDLGITTARQSTDKSRIDNYGSRLLSLCKSFDIHIANGRLFKIKVLELLLVRIILLLIIVLCPLNCSRMFQVLKFYHLTLY